MTIFELIFIVVLLILVVKVCQKRWNRNRTAEPPNPTSTRSRADLDRFRRENRGQAAASESYQRTANTRNSAERKELVRKNLFSKSISGEKSVLDLARLLAISRGTEVAMVDEEVGGCGSIDAGKGAKQVAVEACESRDNLTLNTTMDSESTSVMPEPTAPPLQSRDSVAPEAKRENHSEAQSTSTAHLEEGATGSSIRNLLYNITDTVRRFSQPQASEEKHLECSICLDNFNSNDVIAWAKDGGDPTPISGAASDDTGCDHIFHQECLISWLQQHDDCPLCRRKVVHDNADERFAGWE